VLACWNGETYHYKFSNVMQTFLCAQWNRASISSNKSGTRCKQIKTLKAVKMLSSFVPLSVMYVRECVGIADCLA